MQLKVTKLGKDSASVAKPQVEKKENKAEKQPETKKDTKFKSMVKPEELEVTDESKLVFSVVAREGESAYLDIRTHVHTDVYSGPTKKGIHISTEWLPDLIEILERMNVACDKKGL